MEKNYENVKKDHKIDDLEFCHLKDGNKSLYILFNNKIASVALIVENKNVTTYISCLDSTGYARGWTKAFLISIIKSIPGLLFCFSQPKEEPIFNRSSSNLKKNILDPSQLFRFWTRVFGERCGASEKCKTSCWSNFPIPRSHPFKTIDEIEIFEDEPTSKMIKKIKNLRVLFESLLVRSDFNRGGLVYSQCECRANKIVGKKCNSGNSEFGIVNSDFTDKLGNGDDASKKSKEGFFEEENEKNVEDKILNGKPKSFDESIYSERSDSNLDAVIADLRRMDFSTKKEAKKSSDELIEAHKIELKKWNFSRTKDL